MLSLSVFLLAYPCQKITCFLLPSWFYEDEETKAHGNSFDLSGRTRFVILIFNFKASLLNEHSINMIIFLFEWEIKKHTCIFFFLSNKWIKTTCFFTPVLIGDKKQSCHLSHQMCLSNHQQIKLLHYATIFYCFLLFWITEKSHGN